MSEHHPPPPVLPFTAIVGQETMKQALVLNAINPRIGGVLIRGEKGTAKSSAVRALAEILPVQDVNAGCAFACDPKGPDEWCERCRSAGACGPVTERRPVRVVTLPIGATEDRLVGSIDLERAIAGGVRAFEPGLLAAAHRGILYIDEVNLLDDQLVDLLLDAAAMGVNTVEREGVSVSHPSRFILIGTMNPEEGELRPQLLDRFGLQVTVEALIEPEARMAVVRTAEAFDADPERFRRTWARPQRELGRRIRRARRLLPQITVTDALLRTVAEACIALEVRSHRAEITVVRTARAIAAFDRRTIVTTADLKQAMALALPHRMRRRPFEEPHLDPDRLDDLMPDNDEEPSSPPGGDRPPDPPDDGGDDVSSGPSTPDASGLTILPVGAPAAAPALLPERRRPPRTRHRGSEGRRTLPTVPADRGRPQGCRRAETWHDLALVPTLRAAAPHQQRRTGGVLPVAVTNEDLRTSRRLAHTRAAILFVVDASGSMGVRQRMSAAKGAVVGLLLEAYRHRDRIGLVAFRGATADLVLPLTASVDLARARLAAVPTGGTSPLAAGLVEGLRALERERRRAPALVPVMVLISDGRANVGNGRIRDELMGVAERVREAGVHLLVVDTSPDDVTGRLGYCPAISATAGGQYCRIDRPDAVALGAVAAAAQSLIR